MEKLGISSRGFVGLADCDAIGRLRWRDVGVSTYLSFLKRWDYREFSCLLLILLWMHLGVERWMHVFYPCGSLRDAIPVIC